MITAIAIVLFVVVGTAAIFVDRSRSETARLRMLVELSERLQLSPTIEYAIPIVPSFATRLFPRLEGALFLSHTSPSAVRLATAWSGACEEDVVEMSDCNALTRRDTYVAATNATPTCAHSITHIDSATICVPMVDAGETFGLLLLRAPAGSPLPPSIRRLAEPFAHQIALALSNLRLQQTLRDAAVRDSLTGLFNRRCITESLTVELLSGGNPNARVGVIMLDVDHFKRFNDTWGHGGGDALLRRMATLMLELFGENDDIVCRYGGEEFVVFVANASPEVLRARAERLLERVRELHVECGGHLVGGITISAGLAISPNHGNHIEDLIAAADRALYAAKSAGRDRVAAPRPQVLGQTVAA